MVMSYPMLMPMKTLGAFATGAAHLPAVHVPDEHSSLFSQSSPPPLSEGAVHLLSLQLLLLHSLSSSQSSPAPLPSSLPPPPPPSPSPRHFAPAGPSGQSLVSLHCLLGGLLGRCGGSPEISFLIFTTYGLFLLPALATLSPSALYAWM